MCCGPETPRPTPPPTTSPCSTPRSPSSPTCTDILIRADSAGSPKHSWPTSAASARAEYTPASPSDGPSPNRSTRQYATCPSGSDTPHSNRTAPCATGAQAAELTGVVDLPGLPEYTRIIVRRERPHPGAQLSLFGLDEGMRHQVFLTDTPYSQGSVQLLEVRHRARARVEDRIRCGKTTGFDRFPSRHFQINAAWLELSLAAIDLLAWTQVLLLQSELAIAEPKKLRYRLLHAAARITRGARRLHLRIAATWPWRNELANAFACLATLPRAVT
nr:transposase [Streptomyces sp. WAC 01325]